MTKPLLALFLSSIVAAPAAAELGPCSVEGLPEDARCGFFEVPENRATREGRRIRLHVAVLPATETPKEPDPLFALEGGPGAGISGSAASHVQAFAGIRRHRDVVLVDQRGTGLSHALHCSPRGKDKPAPRGGLISPEAARACRAELEKDADLGWYTTAVAMDDLEDVRAWLGYEKINLFGISYGSRSALVYLRRHGKRVRSVILMAPYPLEENVPRDAAQVAQEALEGTIEDCHADASCRAAFPELAGDLGRLGERFVAEPVQKWNDNTVDHGTFASAVRMMLFFPQLASRVPLIVHSASRGEFGPYVFVSNFLRSSLSKWISLGTFLTILCSEDVAGLERTDVERRAQGTFIGPDWSLGLMDACAEWPRGEVPEGFDEPVRSEVPVLLLTGRRDPSMAPEWATSAVGELPNARAVVVEEGSHNFIGMSRTDCLLGLMTDFVAKGTAEQLEAGCVGEMKRPAFAKP